MLQLGAALLVPGIESWREQEQNAGTREYHVPSLPSVLHLRLGLDSPSFQPSIVSLARPSHSLRAPSPADLSWLTHLPSLFLPPVPCSCPCGSPLASGEQALIKPNPEAGMSPGTGRKNLLGDAFNAEQCTCVRANKQEKPWKLEKSSKGIPGSYRQDSEHGPRAPVLSTDKAGQRWECGCFCF